VDEYATFWENFGPVLKEGLYEDFENREALLGLARFRSSTEDGLVDLAGYVERMKEGQDAIYYITGDEIETLARSPQLEGFRARGVEVLLMTDPVDEFWLPAIAEFDGKAFKSATRAGADLSNIGKNADSEESGDDAQPETPEGVDALIAMVKLELGEAVKDVRVSDRLTDSPVCLVSDEGDIDIRLARLLKANQQLDESIPRVLEINPNHALVTALAGLVGEDGAGSKLGDAAWLLLDQARILEGETLPDPTGFVRRMSDIMSKGFAA
jgi:molecular chaperone HtpG